jgi:putative addiction module killer protein
MFQVLETPEFAAWINNLRDNAAQARIGQRLERLAYGLMGDVKPVGDGVSEMRIHAGPGYRVYFTHCGERIILLLCGGDKSSQKRDIARARLMARMLKD